MRLGAQLHFSSLPSSLHTVTRLRVTSYASCIWPSKLISNQWSLKWNFISRVLLNLTPSHIFYPSHILAPYHILEHSPWSNYCCFTIFSISVQYYFNYHCQSHAVWGTVTSFKPEVTAAFSEFSYSIPFTSFTHFPSSIFMVRDCCTAQNTPWL